MRFSGAVLFLFLLFFAGLISVAQAHPENTCNHCVHHCHYDSHNASNRAPEPPPKVVPTPTVRATRVPVVISTTATVSKRSGRHRHEGGFLRFLGGMVKYNESEDNSALDSGAVWQLGEVSLGGSSSEDLSIHLTLALSSWEPPKNDTSRFASHHDGVIYMGVVGLGMTSHWMPSNFYLSASIGRSFKTRTTVDDRSGLDSLGKVVWHDLGVSAAFGKEWWLSDDLGVGVALQGMLLNTEDGRYIFGGPVLSMTYN
jgi:hypothetical protein